VNGQGSRTVVLVTRDGMGEADRELQQVLVAAYLKTLLEAGRLPEAMCFYADGVKLVCEGSEVLDQLRALSERGVRLIVCTTCLNYFGLMDTLAVGTAGGMAGILSEQIDADKVITI
jgi:selenium metabolism protein YedF